MPRPVDPSNPRGRATWFRYADAASVGIEMVVAIVICALGALWLERNVTHWSPWTSVIGLLIGIGAAGKAVMRVARVGRSAATSEPAKAAPESAARPPTAASDAPGDRPGDSG